MNATPLSLLFLIAMVVTSRPADVAAWDVTPDKLQFRRQAVRRMIFDRSQDIPLAGLHPVNVVGLDLMHPPVGPQEGDARLALERDRLSISAERAASVTRWIGGFNPFATYDLALSSFSGSGQVGLMFRDSEEDHRITITLVVEDGRCDSVRWAVTRDGREVERNDYAVPSSLSRQYPLRLRVQMLAVGANLFVEHAGKSALVGQPDFSRHLELRRKSSMRRIEFCLHSLLTAGARIGIDEATAALTPGCGQADIRAMTRRNGEPLLDDGRLWMTMTVRGRGLPHPLQGVFSMNPSVFDVRFEGIIVFDMGDGLLRNELASHIFYDDEVGEWRGWTTGFSALGTKTKKEEKAILAVRSRRDPRHGFSVMKAKPIGLTGQHEDPHGVWDAAAGRWRLLLSERAGKYRAGMWESTSWDGDYRRLAGPVEMDSTGTLIQKIGARRYVIFGSADRVVYVRTYPDLKPIGTLNMHRPPWNENTGTRIWPNVIPLPPGYPARYLAVMMDRLNFPGMRGSNWTYGAMYLYHAHPPQDDAPYEYGPEAATASRPALQIINGSSQAIDVYWIRPDGDRVSNGTVRPGEDTIITTTLGHRVAVVGQEDGFEATATSLVPVQAFRFDPPDKDGVPAFYTQRVSARGFPIVASARVSPYAVKEAAYLVNLMLARRPDVREAMIQSGARLCILAWNEFTTDQPEWARLAKRPVRGFPDVSPRDYRDARARGMGGSLTDPFCSCAEENLLGYPGDPYAAECILIHELAHNIHLRGMVNVDPTFDKRLEAAYDAAMAEGLWKGKYASVNHHEYFAEGVQSWFDNNRVNDHDHNHVDTREELVEYDPRLAAICREVFGDTKLRYTKPATRIKGHLEGYDPSKAPRFEWPERLDDARAQIRRAAQRRSQSSSRRR